MTDEIREIERHLESVNDIISRVNKEFAGVRVYETLNSLARVKYDLENKLSEAKTIYNEGRMNYPDSVLQGVVSLQYKDYTFVPIETRKAVSYKDIGRVLLIERKDGFDWDEFYKLAKKVDKRCGKTDYFYCVETARAYVPACAGLFVLFNTQNAGLPFYRQTA